MEASTRGDKEAFVSGLEGTSLREIWLVITLLPALSLFHGLLRAKTRFFRDSWSHAVWAIDLVIDTVCLVLPVVAVMTDCLSAVYAIVLTTIGISLLIGSRAPVDGRVLTDRVASLSQALASKRKGFVTSFRCNLTLCTCIAILAVDFRAFPRRFAKAETFGHGLMDIGPGAFVFASGLMLGLKLQAKSVIARGEDAGQLYSVRGLLVRAVTSTGPLVVIGCGRLVATKAVDYQEHTSEYGVHWNFFFTLAAVAIQASLFPALTGPRAALVATALAAVHQATLSCTGVGPWVESLERDTRSGFVGLNKEGLVSMTGYAATMWAGSGAGWFVESMSQRLLNPVKSTQETLSTPAPPAVGGASRDAIHSLTQMTRWLASIAVLDAMLWIAALGLDLHVQPISRRLCNSAYVVWIAALSVWFLVLSAVGEVIGGLFGVGEDLPAFVSGVGTYQLFVFLVGNIMTGGVNMGMDTLRADDWVARVVLVGYVLLLRLFVMTCLMMRGRWQSKDSGKEL